MKVANQLSLSRLVAKIDNDFNISENDWIPRVAAWTIDGLSQMGCLPLELKQRELEVSNRIAIFPYDIQGPTLKVFDLFGHEIPNIAASNAKSLSHNMIHGHTHPGTIAHVQKHGYGCEPEYRHLHLQHEENIAVIDPCHKHEHYHIGTIVSPVENRNYVLDGRNIELNFDTNAIIVESLEVKTYHDDYYDCDCPYIYDNGLLLEALAWYVLFKYMSRGGKHQVYDLGSTNPVLNPYQQWINLKPKAMASVKISILNDRGWNNFFYNSTFLPRER